MSRTSTISNSPFAAAMSIWARPFSLFVRRPLMPSSPYSATTFQPLLFAKARASSSCRVTDFASSETFCSVLFLA